MERFNGSFTQQDAIPEEGIERAIAVMRHGRLHRYNTQGDEIAEAALLEEEFATFTGAKYALAVASGGYALGCALRALELAPDEVVLTNAFTLAPVPGAIAAAGGQPVFVEITPDLVLDLADLEAKAKTTQARILMLSHMRGHICDMDALMALCARLKIAVIEDCAHTMGASWAGVQSGRHGVIGCYSTQTYKHMNSGEGGLLVTDDPELAARMVLLSGSYMLYGRHRAAPKAEAFQGLTLDVPNVSGRMDNLRAAILRPQLRILPARIEAWNRLYRRLEAGLARGRGIGLIARPEAEHYVASSFQFLLPNWQEARIKAFLTGAIARGVELKWFGAQEPVAFTSRYPHWRYAGGQSCPQTDQVLAGLIDMRLPLTFSLDDVDMIARIICDELAKANERREFSECAPPVVD